jgi:hypothetical protein
MLRELAIGCIDYPDVKCGFIGEVGSGWPLHGECCHWHTYLSKIHSYFSLFFQSFYDPTMATHISNHLKVLISEFLFSSVLFTLDSWMFQILKEEQS